MKVLTYKTAHDSWHVVRWERGHTMADSFNHGDGTKDSDESPEYWHQVALLLGFRLAITKPV
jgi:hypothetical protein